MIALPKRCLPLLVAATAVLLSGCGSGEPAAGGRDAEDPGAIHIHGLGINPRDGALYIATHTGLFRAAPGETEASRVTERQQDTMGFTVVGPDHFLGSGHPDARDELPPFLGLIESRDAGRTWQPVSLLGEADFHVLEAQGPRVYGFGSDWKTREAQFLASSDRGETWQRRTVPEPLLSLAVHPRDPRRLVASGPSGIHRSSDGGKSWEPRGAIAGLVVWSSPEELILVDEEGWVHASTDGRTWREVGDVGGQPAALESERDGLYVALHDGTVKRSSDGGASWAVRASPGA